MPSLAFGLHLLHGLREDVGGAVPQHVEAVLLLRGDRLDGVAVGEHVREVAQLAVDPGDQDRPVALEQVAGSRLLRHRSLVSSDVDGDLGRHAVVLLAMGDAGADVAHRGSSLLTAPRHGRAGFGSASGRVEDEAPGVEPVAQPGRG